MIRFLAALILALIAGFSVLLLLHIIYLIL